MTADKTEDLLFDISGKLASIEAKLDSLSETILKHESRISKLEDDFKSHLLTSKPETNDFKSEIIRLLSKALIIGLVSIASLVGASGLVTKILGF